MNASADHPRRTKPPAMSALAELVQLGNDKGYEVHDTSSDGRRSYTFGQEGVFVLHVRFDKFWRVENATYLKAPDFDDQYILRREKHKRDKVYWVLNLLPNTFEHWDKCFPVGGAA